MTRMMNRAVTHRFWFAKKEVELTPAAQLASAAVNIPALLQSSPLDAVFCTGTANSDLLKHPGTGLTLPTAKLFVELTPSHL